jgi:uncharacterized protein (TIGR04255 family)
MQGRQYKSPPIEEALVEFHFVPSRPWNWTVPGRLWEQMQGTYSGEPGSQGLVFSQPQTGGPDVPRGGAVTRLLLRSAEGNRLVGLGENALSIHALRPYGGWDEFRPRIVSALEAYWRLEAPAGVDRISLRYINKVPLPDNGGDILLDRYFALGPRFPGGPSTVSQFLTRVQGQIDQSTTASLTMASAPSEAADQKTAVLDFELVHTASDSLDQARALDLVDALRQKERELFEAAITDEARDLFDR